MKRWLPFLLIVLPHGAAADGFDRWWLTPDQKGQRLLKQEKYEDASRVFEDPARRAAACYRGGDFECAASLWGAIRGAVPAYNRGNALVLLGRYDEAIEAYSQALSERPDWKEAVQNREIARLRAERLEPVEDDAGGTGGMLGADEIRFDDSGRVDAGGSEVSEEGGQGLSDASMRATWLRRVESNPSDFLRARFAYQTYSLEQGSENEE